jgi:hypothetical protein
MIPFSTPQGVMIVANRNEAHPLGEHTIERGDTFTLLRWVMAEDTRCQNSVKSLALQEFPFPYAWDPEWFDLLAEPPVHEAAKSEVSLKSPVS